MYFFEDNELVLTEDQYKYIKELRCGPVMHSWRSLARKFTRRYPSFVEKYKLEEMADKNEHLEMFGFFMEEEEKSAMTTWENGNQLLGIDLCTAAMQYFNESVEDGWN